MDLAQVCRAQFHPWANVLLWVTCEVAIAACDIAEVLGSAIAMKLPFGLPIIYGCLFTAAYVLLLLFFGTSLQQRSAKFYDSVPVAVAAASVRRPPLSGSGQSTHAAMPAGGAPAPISALKAALPSMIRPEASTTTTC